jgi:cell wall-associated NlpC family hydrolase
MKRKILFITILILTVSVKTFCQEQKNIVSQDSTAFTDSSQRAILIDYALKYLGVKYRHGQSNEHGFDCSGFTMFVYKKFDYKLARSSQDQYKQCKHIHKEEAQPGDLVFFITRGRRISHVGIYLGGSQFVHARSYGKGVAVSNIESTYYKRRLAGFGTML